MRIGEEAKKWKAMTLRVAALPEVQRTLEEQHSYGPARPDWEVLEDVVRSLCSDLEDAKAEIRRHHQDFDRWEGMAAKGARLIEENKSMAKLVEVLLEDRDAAE